MKILRFEDSKAWQAARTMAASVTSLTEGQQFNTDPTLRRQMNDAATSAMANIAEGFKAGSDREFTRFLKIAIRSAAEVQSHLYRALDRHWIPQTRFDELYRACDNTRGLIGGWIRYLSRPRQAKSSTRKSHSHKPAGKTTKGGK